MAKSITKNHKLVFLILLLISVLAVSFVLTPGDSLADVACGTGDTCNVTGQSSGDLCREEIQICLKGPEWTDGVFGTSGIMFLGGDDEVSINSTWKNTLSSFTVSIWLNPSDITSSEVLVTGINGHSAGYYGPGFATSGSRLRFYAITGGVYQNYYTPTGIITANQWHHAVATFNSSNNFSEIYIDGVRRATHTFGPGGLSGGTAPTVLGRYSPYYSYSFEGKLDEFRIYNRVLNSAEINQLYNNQNVSSGLLGNFRMDENSGTTTADSSGNGNIGYLLPQPLPSDVWSMWECYNTTNSGQCEVSGDSCTFSECGNCQIIASGACTDSPPDTTSCPFEAQPGRIIVDLAGSSVLANTPGRETDGPFSANIPPGNYKVWLASHDDSHPSGGTQPEEMFYLNLFDSLGSIVAVTNPISDLPDDATAKSEIVNENLTISETITEVTVNHAAFPSTNVNSTGGPCAAFDNIDLSVDLSANPSSGIYPLDSVLTATVTTSATDTINYSFWWDCSYSNSDIAGASSQCGALTAPPAGECLETPGIGYKCDGISATTQATPSHTYASTSNAKVIVEQGFSASVSDAEIVTVINNNPTINSVTIDEPDYCLTGPSGTQIIWDYFDPDGNPQGHYQVQIAEGPSYDFNNPAVDSLKTEDLSGNTFNYYPPAGSLNFGSSFKARVKTWDSGDLESPWVESSIWPTSEHAYPEVDFSFAPSLPEIGQTVQFVDGTQFFDGGGTRTWNWDFDDSTFSNSQNPTHVFIVDNLYNVTLTATDSDGLFCSLTKAVLVGKKLPRWIEIGPKD
ncbi:MAG: LamG-like jellyroll fold domain-containing protein [bacterium]|nr:LamG-like jellyroll fold domain-containing protein [bacterium]